jgi:hypothetical protein
MKKLTWDGTVYRNMKTVSTNTISGGECGKACYEATSRNGTVVMDFTTQGAASLALAYGKPDSDGLDEAECDLAGTMTNFYDARGNRTGSSTTQSGTTTFYDARGNKTGSATRR